MPKSRQNIHTHPSQAFHGCLPTWTLETLQKPFVNPNARALKTQRKSPTFLRSSRALAPLLKTAISAAEPSSAAAVAAFLLAAFEARLAELLPTCNDNAQARSGVCVGDVNWSTSKGLQCRSSSHIAGPFPAMRLDIPNSRRSFPLPHTATHAPTSSLAPCTVGQHASQCHSG